MLGAGSMAVCAVSVEILAPLMMLCWLCCWPDDDHDDDNSSAGKPPKGKPPKKPILVKVKSNNGRGSSSRSASHRLASSAASLHLPGASGIKQPLSAHRSHEELPRRLLSNLGPQDDTRYHSAPSVIDEVIHRRDWERSTKELYIPLRSEAELLEFRAFHDDDLEPPRAYPESSSIASFNNKSIERLSITCKKHYTNIKSSKNKNKTNKEEIDDEYKDKDATEFGSKSNFFIGDSSSVDGAKQINANNEHAEVVDTVKTVYKAKEAKQSFNESIRNKDNVVTADDVSSLVSVSRQLSWCHVKHLEPDLDDATDRSGAIHHSLESRCSLPYVTTPLPATSSESDIEPPPTPAPRYSGAPLAPLAASPPSQWPPWSPANGDTKETAI